jgi:hypothetical protein
VHLVAFGCKRSGDCSFFIFFVVVVAMVLVLFFFNKLYYLYCRHSEKQKQALENIQKLDQTSIAARPSWNTSMMFPYRYRQMSKDEIPCLGRMFKPMSFWRQGCNPKVKVPKKPSVAKNHQLMHRQHKMRQELAQNTTISTFSKHAQYVSPQFKRHLQRPGMSAPTPEASGFYIPPSGIRQDFPHLTDFFTGGNAKKLVRAFMKYETPL